jgi:hypothetical protein
VAMRSYYLNPLGNLWQTAGKQLMLSVAQNPEELCRRLAATQKVGAIARCPWGIHHLIEMKIVSISLG